MRRCTYAIVECPHCGSSVEMDPIDNNDLVTYWGEDGPVGVWCDSCYLDFEVREHIVRTYSVIKNKKKFVPPLT